jgi:hypothetical protein
VPWLLTIGYRRSNCSENRLSAVRMIHEGR